LYLKTGNEEKLRVRLKDGNGAVVLKFFEFLFKWGISIALWFWYAVTGRELQGRYVFYSQWFTFKGFLMKEVFVR
jgi:hypothetical protein